MSTETVTTVIRPTSASGSNWSDAQNIYDDNTSTAATVSIRSSNYSSRYLTVNFSTIDIPDNATVTSAVLNVVAKQSSSTSSRRITVYADVDLGTATGRKRIISEQLTTTSSTTLTGDLTNNIQGLDNTCVEIIGYMTSSQSQTFTVYEVYIDVTYEIVIPDPEPEQPENNGHYYETYTNYPIEIEDEKLCTEHKSYLTEIYGNTENGKMVGVEQSDGTYKITLIISGNTPQQPESPSVEIEGTVITTTQGYISESTGQFVSDDYYITTDFVDTRTSSYVYINTYLLENSTEYHIEVQDLVGYYNDFSYGMHAWNWRNEYDSENTTGIFRLKDIGFPYTKYTFCKIDKGGNKHPLSPNDIIVTFVKTE